MGSEDLEYTVVYSPIEVKLTVSYIDFETGEKVIRDTVLTMKAGENYRVETPEVEGYEALMPEVYGRMPAMDASITVFMRATGSETRTLIAGRMITGTEIENYGTPLGVPNSILGNGETIE